MITDETQESLLRELGLETLPQERREALEKQMMDALSGRIGDALIKQLSEPEKEALFDLVDRDQEIDEFLRDHVPNHTSIIEEVVLCFRNDMLNIRNMFRSSRPK